MHKCKIPERLDLPVTIQCALCVSLLLPFLKESTVFVIGITNNRLKAVGERHHQYVPPIYSAYVHIWQEWSIYKVCLLLTLGAHAQRGLL